MATLLNLTKKADEEEWMGPKDLAINHDRFLAEILETDLKRIHNSNR